MNTYLPQDDEFVSAAIPSTHICRRHRWNCFHKKGQVHFMCTVTNLLSYTYDKITTQSSKSHFVFNRISFLTEVKKTTVNQINHGDMFHGSDFWHLHLSFEV